MASPVAVHTSTVVKSIAASVDQCARMKVRQEVLFRRCVAGSRPLACRISATVVRPKRVVLRGLDLNGKEVIMEGSDLLARAFCHEMDHLDGRFFLDHLSFIKRDMIKRRIRKLIRQGKWE